MIKININKEHNNGGTLFVKDGRLYKVYDSVSYFVEEKQRNIEFIKNNHIPNTPIIYELLYKDNNFNGYIMQYLEDTYTLRNGMFLEVADEDKISIIKDIYTTLKYLHNLDITLGDIHMDNFLFKDNHGYVIDLDEIRFKGDDFKFRECYVVRETKDSKYDKRPSKISDNIKVAICCLSFLYKIDFEAIISKYSLEEVKLKLASILSSEDYEKFNRVLDCHNLVYLDDVLTNTIKRG